MPVKNQLRLNEQMAHSGWGHYDMRSDGCAPWSSCPTRLTEIESKNKQISSSTEAKPGVKYTRIDGKYKAILPYKSRNEKIADERSDPGYKAAYQKVDKMFSCGGVVLVSDLVKVGNFRAVVDVWRKYRGYSFQLSRKDYDKESRK